MHHVANEQQHNQLSRSLTLSNIKTFLTHFYKKALMDVSILNMNMKCHVSSHSRMSPHFQVLILKFEA